MKRRLNDATPEEHDAVNYYKKLDERLPDDFWDSDERIDVIGQNGNDGLHYEAVSKPKHYMLFDFEVIDLIYEILSKEEFSGYCLGNVLKYRLRAGKKGDALEDLAKASEYEKIWERYYGAN